MVGHNAIIRKYKTAITEIELKQTSLTEKDSWVPAALINSTIVKNYDYDEKVVWDDRSFGIKSYDVEEKEADRDVPEPMPSIRSSNRLRKGTHSERLKTGPCYKISSY